VLVGQRNGLEGRHDVRARQRPNLGAISASGRRCEQRREPWRVQPSWGLRQTIEALLYTDDRTRY
jgi:hypothetical protein